MIRKKTKNIFALLSVLLLMIVTCAVCIFASPKANASAATANVIYSNYSGYDKYMEFEVGVGTAEPVYVVCYRSKAGTKYVSNGLVSINGFTYAIEHTKGDEATISYSTTVGDSLTIGGGVGGSLGVEVGGIFNKVGAEISAKIGYDHTSSSEQGSTVTFNIGMNAPSGRYSIEECTTATEFIFDLYNANWKTVQESYKEGKKTLYRDVKVHDGYEKYKNSQSHIWMSEPNATVFYKLVKIY